MLIRAEDEHQLHAVSNSVVNNYIREAPLEAKTVGTSGGPFSAPKWRRNHQRGGDLGYYWRYSRQCYEGEPDFVMRPAAWGALQYGNGWTRLCFNEEELARDVRVAYNSSRYPWILAVHRFAISFHYPKSYDTARFQFPPWAAPGQHIVHYNWGGYKDCVDVDVLPHHKKVSC